MSNIVDLLPANLQSTLHQIVQQSNASNGGIQAILLSTAEGVPLGRVYADRDTPLNEDVLSSIESTWAPASKQFPLLNMGKEARIVTAIYDHGTFILFEVLFAPFYFSMTRVLLIFFRRHYFSCLSSTCGEYLDRWAL
jgi:hypothetical protein